MTNLKIAIRIVTMIIAMMTQDVHEAIPAVDHGYEEYERKH